MSFVPIFTHIKPLNDAVYSPQLYAHEAVIDTNKQGLHFKVANPGLTAAGPYPEYQATMAMSPRINCNLFWKTITPPNGTTTVIYNNNGTIKFEPTTNNYKDGGIYTANEIYWIVVKNTTNNITINDVVLECYAASTIDTPLSTFTTGDTLVLLESSPTVSSSVDPVTKFATISFTSYPFIANQSVMLAWNNKPATSDGVVQITLDGSTVFGNATSFNSSFSSGEFITFIITPQVTGTYTGVMTAKTVSTGSAIPMYAVPE